MIADSLCYVLKNKICIALRKTSLNDAPKFKGIGSKHATSTGHDTLNRILQEAHEMGAQDRKFLLTLCNHCITFTETA